MHGIVGQTHIHFGVSLSCVEQSWWLTAARHEMVAKSEPKL